MSGCTFLPKGMYSSAAPPGNYDKVAEWVRGKLPTAPIESAQPLWDLAADAADLLHIGGVPQAQAFDDPYAWLALHMMDLGLVEWRLIIDFTQPFITTRTIDAFYFGSRFIRSSPPKQSSRDDIIVVLSTHPAQAPQMALATWGEDGVYRLQGASASPVAIDGHLSEEMDYIAKMGAAPYWPTFIVTSQAVLYRSRCQWMNYEMEWLSRYQRLHRFRVFVYSSNAEHRYVDGWYVDSKAWEHEPVSMRTRSGSGKLF